MTATVRLDESSVNAVAERVAELLRDESARPDLIDAAEVARRFSVSRDYVYEHADELGAIRLGTGSRPPLRFDPVTVRERIAQRTIQVRKLQRESRAPVRSRSSVDLLPIKGGTV